MSVMVPVSWGELIDKFTILEIKSERLRDPVKLAHVRTECAGLLALRDQAIETRPEVAPCETELKAINETLWDVEDAIRDCERMKDFGPRFIELARAVYQQNDHRSEIKRRINQLLDSGLVEEKSYQPY